MLISYDPDLDAIYIRLSEARPVDSLELNDSVTANIDSEGRLTSIEILDARQQLGESELELTVEGLKVYLQPGEPATVVERATNANVG